MSGALRVLGAALITVTLALGALGVAAVGVGRHLEDSCTTRPEAVAIPELTVVRGPLVEGLATFRCEVSGGPDVVFTDWLPLVWGASAGLVALAAVAVTWWSLVVAPQRRAPAPS